MDSRRQVGNAPARDFFLYSTSQAAKRRRWSIATAMAVPSRPFFVPSGQGRRPNSPGFQDRPPGTAVAPRVRMATPTGAVRPASPGRPAPDHAAATARAEGEALAARLREIADAAEAPLDALEPALRAILEKTATAAGAVCLFDQRHELLRLAAEA